MKFYTTLFLLLLPFLSWSEERPYEFNQVVYDGNAAAGNLFDGSTNSQVRARYNVFPALNGLVFNAPTYQALVGQVLTELQAGALGSGASNTCSSCDCATNGFDNDLTLRDKGLGDKTYFYSNMTVSQFTSSVDADTYPILVNEFSCRADSDCTFSPDGSLTCGRLGQCVAMNFAYTETTCTRTSPFDEPYEFEQTSERIDDKSGMLTFQHVPCEQSPRFPNGAAASVLDISPTSGQSVCVVGARSQFELRLQLDEQTTTNAVSISAPSTQPGFRVPLGSTFFIEVEEDGQSPTLDTVLTNQVVQSQEVGAAFRDQVLLEFDRDSSTIQRNFLAVRNGTATIEVISSTGAQSTIEIEVYPPSTLGATSNQYDGEIVEAASKWGISPQLIKSVIRQESDFNPEAYRYEPLSRYGDLRAFVLGSFTFRNERLREVSQYSDYRIGTGPNETYQQLPPGQFFDPTQIRTREIYDTLRDGSSRKIVPTDDFVTILELLTANDSGFGLKNPSVEDQNWSQEHKVYFRRIRKTPEVLNVTAQTSLSASYGLMQLLYISASDLGWTGLKPSGRCRFGFPADCSPTGLFDPAENIGLGAQQLATLARKAKDRGTINLESSMDIADFRQQLVSVLNLYNGRRTNNTYGSRVMGHYPDYYPTVMGGLTQ